MAATLPCPIGGSATVTRDHLTTHPLGKELRTSNHLTTHPPDEELPIAASRPTSSEWATGRATVVRRCATDSSYLLVCSCSAECPWVRSDVEEGAVLVLHLRACARHRRAGGARSRGRVRGGEVTRDCLRVRERETRGGRPGEGLGRRRPGGDLELGIRVSKSQQPSDCMNRLIEILGPAGFMGGLKIGLSRHV
jgi:hypothetical protein